MSIWFFDEALRLCDKFDDESGNEIVFTILKSSIFTGRAKSNACCGFQKTPIDIESAVEDYYSAISVMDKAAANDRVGHHSLDYDRAEAQASLAKILEEEGVGRFREALPLYKEMLAYRVHTEVKNPSNNDANSQYFLSVDYTKVGEIEHKLGNLTETMRLYKMGMGHAQAAVTAEPNVAKWQYSLGNWHFIIGEVAEELGQLDEARHQYAEGAKITERAYSRWPSDPEADTYFWMLEEKAKWEARLGVPEAAQCIPQGRSGNALSPARVSLGSRVINWIRADLARPW
jgi:tetratricopeptide (TPR) repeat protein